MSEEQSAPLVESAADNATVSPASSVTPTTEPPIAVSVVAKSVPPAKPKTTLKPYWYYLIFAASGFAGLIYESIWARYLKLFLGHAAYAQTLVLVIFLLGLVAGSLLCARLSARLRHPLLWYVAAEIIVALVAVYFHDIFVLARGWATDTVLPTIASDTAAEWFKWGLGAVLIFPQSVLLGATFPLMSAGVVRLFPASPGRVVALLYFSNSLGAAIGVLASGFLFIPLLGLPGTLLVAGLINTFAAFMVWGLGWRFNDVAASLSPPAAATPPLSALILGAAFVTGVASFIYEIVWVRMLSLLLGTSTHNFEIMLSAFILGLAIGGWLVRRRADGKTETLSLLGVIQLMMGVFALWSLFAFPFIYDTLNDFLRDVPRNDDGYTLFLGFGLVLSMLMMLPATVCAGMTLPLLTKRLMNSGGEGAVGRVYAANTAGAIVGVFLAVHVLLPNAGLQLALLTGAVLDMGLGLVLFAVVAKARVTFALPLTGAVLVLALVFGGINPQIAAAGVFRYQDIKPLKIVYYADGKTASISVAEYDKKEKGKSRSIATNGKIDAGVMYLTAGEKTANYSSDETTMALLGLLPLVYRPQAEKVLNIGFGSGTTSRVLLASPSLQRLDNVEIEPKIIEGARLLGARVAPVFDDKRNHFIINDAKTVLARAGGFYDVIISEPSNTWVSGVANLFTQEFYRRVRLSLAKDGIFVQWMHLYETEPRIVASVIKAMSQEFGDFTAYLSSTNDLIIVATPAEILSSPSDALFNDAAMRELLSSYRLHALADVEVLSLGSMPLLLPYFQSFPSPPNSDYHSFMENNAHRAFFSNSIYVLGEIPLLPVPVREMAGGGAYSFDGVADSLHSTIAQKARGARIAYENRLVADGEVQSWLVRLPQLACPSAQEDGVAYLEAISSLITLLMPFTKKSEMADIWSLLEQDDCMKTLLAGNDNIGAVYAQLWRALSLREGDKMVTLAEVMLPYVELSQESGQILMLAAMAGHYQQGNYERVVFLIQDLPLVDPVVHHAARFLAANAAEKI